MAKTFLIQKLIIYTIMLDLTYAVHESIVTFNSSCTAPHHHHQTLESINCKANNADRFIRITNVKIEKQYSGHGFEQEREEKLFEAFSNLCNTLVICHKGNKDIIGHLTGHKNLIDDMINGMGLKCKPHKPVSHAELSVTFLCLDKNGSAANFTPPAGIFPTNRPSPSQDKPQSSIGVFGEIGIGLAIFAAGAVFVCAIIYIRNSYKKGGHQAGPEDMYAEIDYGQMSSSVTPEGSAPAPPNKAGTPHPFLAPMQLYSSVRESPRREGSRREGSRRKIRAPSKKRRADKPPNFIPPDPEEQEGKVFRLRPPPQSFKKNPKGVDNRESETYDTLVEDNCVYNLGGAAEWHQMSPLDKSDKDSGLDDIL